MIMAKVQGLGLSQLCEALGVERPNEVRRIVVDIDHRVGYPVLYIERIGDTDKIVAALTDPNIVLEVRPAADLTRVDGTQDGPIIRGSVRGNIAWGNGNVTQRS